MKKILLDSNKSYYKANLHCHTVCSDGKLTPQEVKDIYVREGYSVVAYTDHNVMVGHSDLSDDKFLALNGYEMNIDEETEEKSWEESRTCHLCYIALEPDNLTQVCYHREKYFYGGAADYKDQLKYDESQPDYERYYTTECINDMIAQGRDNGFFVTYNHPAWSLETLNEYGKYTGMNAMEICNYGCVECGYPDYNEKEYDEILRNGEKIYCVGGDDNHNHRSDSFGAFTVINADKLEYRTITKALEEGKFYASQGPAIYDVWYEDGKIGINCSDAAKIVLNTGVRRAEIRYNEDGAPVNNALFDVKKGDKYVRITVTDACGKHANTSAYFVEDLMND